jgi:site-specific DNA-methyltransferase (adenine-specific)
MILEQNINAILNQDCLDVMHEIQSGEVDLIVTDPPYLIDYKTNYRNDKSHKFCSAIKNDSNPVLVSRYIEECFRLLKDNSAMYMFCGQMTLDWFLREVDSVGFILKNIIVWNKNNWTAGDLTGSFGRKWEPLLLLAKGTPKIRGFRFHDVWDFDRVAGKKQLHQNEKPISLIERCIETFSDKGDLVFDGFMGSGTTAVAARNKGRNYLGCELDKGYFDVCVNRIKL